MFCFVIDNTLINERDNQNGIVFILYNYNGVSPSLQQIRPLLNQTVNFHICQKLTIVPTSGIFIQFGKPYFKLNVIV